jgi:arylsulfatase A-like enzyme
MNPPDVPGMFFSNRPIDLDRPHITDIAPTVLDLFGVPIPAHMDGKSIMTGGKTLPVATQPMVKPKGDEVAQPA